MMINFVTSSRDSRPELKVWKKPNNNFKITKQFPTTSRLLNYQGTGYVENLTTIKIINNFLLRIFSIGVRNENREFYYYSNLTSIYGLIQKDIFLCFSLRAKYCKI